jgi:hypothetical protein
MLKANVPFLANFAKLENSVLLAYESAKCVMVEVLRTKLGLHLANYARQGHID